MAYHLRSASTPSRPRSNKTEVEQQLQSLSTTISSPSATIDTMCDGLRRLGDIYSCIEKMMCTPSSQAELGRSLVVLDLCNGMRDSFMELKLTVQELLLALRRGEGVSSQVKAYVRLVNKVQKQFKKISKKTTSDKNGSRVVMLMAEAREITMSLLESTSSILSKQVEMPKWSLASKTFQRSKVVCQEEQLQALEHSIGDLESGVELLYRRLIQNIVSLLNILSSYIP
ncbi:hypothetical protein VPH35_123119 [Triticum aestivum]